MIKRSLRHIYMVLAKTLNVDFFLMLFSVRSLKQCMMITSTVFHSYTRTSSVGIDQFSRSQEPDLNIKD